MEPCVKLPYFPPECEEMLAGFSAMTCAASPEEGYVEELQIEDWTY